VAKKLSLGKTLKQIIKATAKPSRKVVTKLIKKK